MEQMKKDKEKTDQERREAKEQMDKNNQWMTQMMAMMRQLLQNQSK